MRKKILKRITGTMLAVVMALAFVVPNGASQLDELLEQTEGLEDYLKEFTVSMMVSSRNIEDIEDQIAEVNEKIAENEELLAAAEAAAEEQYQKMKQRIQYMYETDELGYAEALLNSDSFVDFVNKCSFITSIVSYDREMLDLYNDAVAQISRLKDDLSNRQAQLQALKDNANNQFASANELAASINNGLAKFGIEKSDISSILSEYKAAHEAELNKVVEEVINYQNTTGNTSVSDYFAGQTSTSEEPAGQPAEESSEETSETETNAETSTESTVAESTEETTKETATENQTTQDQTTEKQTTEPATTEPKTTEPATTEPATTEPKTTEPVTTEPVTTEPATEPYVEPATEPATEPVQQSYSDAYMMACVISAEVGYESYACQLALASLIMNRVYSPSFPNTVEAVLYAPGQFDVVYWDNYKYYLQNGPMESALSAAYEALNGNITHNYYYYCAGWYYREYASWLSEWPGEYISNENEEWFYDCWY